MTPLPAAPDPDPDPDKAGAATAAADRSDSTDAAHLRDKRRATWAGVWLNAPMALVKIIAGIAAQSHALVADGVHSLSDLVSDAAVLWALGHSHRPPDADHPFGHGRFETLATLAVAIMLALAGLGIVLDAGQRLFTGEVTVPRALALYVAAGSIALKEGLFHYTRAVARRTGSPMMEANAWHHRSDALSSVVALAGIGAAMLGVPAMDALAAGVIAAMLGRIAWVYGRPAVRELVDTAPPEATAGAILDALVSTPGVRDAHDLRLRRMGGQIQADVHIALDPAMTLSEAHRLSEAARIAVLHRLPEVAEIVIHAEPDGHADGAGAHQTALRPELQRIVRLCLEGTIPADTIGPLRLEYRDHGVIALVEIASPPLPGAEARIAARLHAHREGAGGGDLLRIRLLWSTTGAPPQA